MFEQDSDMALSNEDLFMLILGGLTLLFSFSDILAETQAAISFPAIGLFIIGWGIVRFRHRPLPKQIQSTRMIYLSLVKTVRNYALFSIIIQNIFLLSDYVQPNDEARLITIYSFVVLMVTSILEIAGHVTVPDQLHVIHQIEGEDEYILKKKRTTLLYGVKFWVWITITTVFTLGALLIPLYTAFFVALQQNQILVVIFQFVALLLGAGLYVFTYRQTMSFVKLEKAEMIIKAVDFYNAVDLRARSYEILEDFVETKYENLGLMSKLAVMNTQDENHYKVLELTRKILNETEEKSLSVPHMIARAHLLQAISHKALDNYKLAYEEVTKSLHFIPENNVARKLRRDLRRILKVKEQEKE
ncbi:MAG: hypothetical protein KGD64_08875 [Candidatus Heimdallarchaeota archaeon]|nr:hypothetical protein [Candidatus Heimdallarchaeota archaeon]